MAESFVFYHIYPLGLCGAPELNDFRADPENRLEQLFQWTDHLLKLGVNAVYIGPLFESTKHGYDTADYNLVDRRLGTNENLKALVAHWHQNGISTILDGVFNHVGRDFWAFKDVQEKKEASPYCKWFHGLQFGHTNSYGDPFKYSGWHGHYDLVKLDLSNADVRRHLLDAVGMWISDLGIDGLRLDAADQVSLDFHRELAAFCKQRKPGFWLVGEIIHGDYNTWAAPGLLDSVTNYEAYKGLWSSHNDKNFHEIGWSLNREFGAGPGWGLYRSITSMYNFADNHDVDRVASVLKKAEHLDTLYALLFTMPGVPSVYYGSEWGLQGKKQGGDDSPMRPALSIADGPTRGIRPQLADLISRLAKLRHQSQALKRGAYEQLHVASLQLVFARYVDNEFLVVGVNAADQDIEVAFTLKSPGTQLRNLEDPSKTFSLQGNYVKVLLPKCGFNIFVLT